ncbi:uncharacterized protein E0L32_012427 [Thyridium curvatum]|uniref:Secreted protein n=1 Tax=Thyridium curvatum TaxID=1093900 RepID=A0A507B9X6_9PEZI|nr:uncharacterized protein E0L32_012427 [Thyridium curvatum]TPX16413.1 hypothetical protein E0L32_012427 [Thyridium curvatum]
MKFSVSNNAAAAAAAAFFLLAGGPLASAQGGVMQPAPFEITGFFAGTVPHSSQNYYTFTASQGPDKTANCSANLLSYQHMADVPVTACASAQPPQWSFNFTRATDGAGALLKVWLNDDKVARLEGDHHIPADQIVTSGVGTGIKEEYTGPHDFVITDVKVVA